MTRTGLAPSLTGHDDVPIVQIHPLDANRLGLSHNTFAELYNDLGRFIGQVDVTNDVTQGQLYSPIHWTDKFASDSIVSKIVSPDSRSYFRATRVQGKSCFNEGVRVFAMGQNCQQRTDLKSAVGILGRIKNSPRIHNLVGCKDQLDWQGWLKDHHTKSIDQIRYFNPIAQSEALVMSSAERIEALVLVEQRVENLPSFIWLENAFDSSVKNLKTLLRGEIAERDALICGCFRTNRKKIMTAIQAGDNTQQLLANSLGCGSKCGSCRPELNQLLAEAKKTHI